MKVRILGRDWRLLFSSRMPKGIVGLCEHPEEAGKTIRIKRGQNQRDELDTTIHEMLHAFGWHLSEEAVTEAANDMATILWRLGWRKDA